MDGIDVQVAQSVIAEVGVDLRAFPSEKHFSHWLGLCPTHETSGGKVLKRRTPKVVNRAKAAFRQAASTLIRSQSDLGAPYRRLRTRLGAPKAITAMARKLSCLFYRLLKYGQQSVDKGVEFYEAKKRKLFSRKANRREADQVVSGKCERGTQECLYCVPHKDSNENRVGYRSRRSRSLHALDMARP